MSYLSLGDVTADQIAMFQAQNEAQAAQASFNAAQSAAFNNQAAFNAGQQPQPVATTTTPPAVTANVASPSLLSSSFLGVPVWAWLLLGGGGVIWWAKESR